uniref:Uncharacterized protein n=1 Tax=Anguilla anguilla TaxID=7936 RepID=A0A0E9W0V0_ANGAN
MTTYVLPHISKSTRFVI